ncbi:DUF4856 domain-containing protein [Spongiivirga sp. MCCC 1A20706]|uniref:DUF4856 domain-containing protein n=1 Tax=Spongiivirga sp. MCCC 1A20706 TaxID=3160963 RepID=UPI0039775C05
MKLITKSLALTSLCFIGFSCSSDDDNMPPIDNTVVAPATYSFERDGSSTVSFGGQTTRIKMGEELADMLKDWDNNSEQILLDMYANQNTPFAEAALNGETTKILKAKTANSADFFANDPTASAEIRAEFEDFMTKQITEVKPNIDVVATAGNAGQIADGSSTRYVNDKGLEYDQAIVKGLIGALMADQAINHYLGTNVLDESTNRADNDADIVAEGKVYTTMEHKWDEAFGYAYGLNADPANPNADLGADSFLNKYIGRVEGDDDFAGIAADIFDAFKLGRAAIVAKNYTVRDEQANILRGLISKVIGIRAVYYLQQGKNALANEDFGGGFHDISEGYGFIYSLQFTRKPGTNEPYFTRTQVQSIISRLMGDGDNGLWTVTSETLDALSAEIAAEFDFTVAQAGS